MRPRPTTRRLRILVGCTALAAAMLAVLSPATPAGAYFHPMPTPSGPHHWHKEKNPSAAALALMSSKQKGAIAKGSGAARHFSKEHCVTNCVDPLAVRYGVRTASGSKRGVTTGSGEILCGWFAIYIYAKNFADAKIWQFEIRTDYCRNSGTARVISHKTTVHPTVYTWASALGWAYKGTTEVSAWEPFGNNTAVRTYAQGHFDYCPPRIWCVQTRYPYAYLDIYGTGDRIVSKWGA